MAGGMARGSIVIHEDFMKVFGSGGPCILRPNSMDETMD